MSRRAGATVIRKAAFPTRLCAAPLCATPLCGPILYASILYAAIMCTDAKPATAECAAARIGSAAKMRIAANEPVSFCRGLGFPLALRNRRGNCHSHHSDRTEPNDEFRLHYSSRHFLDNPLRRPDYI